MKQWIRNRYLGTGVCMIVTVVALAGCGGGSHSSASSNGSGKSAVSDSSAVLTVESSQQNAIDQNFNPFIQSSAATLLGATSLVYEPLLQTNAIKPGVYYNWLASGYSWSHGGNAITFKIRPGVKWSNGHP